ncbi:MAG: hypothetical protein LBQ61_05435 [Spirochaetales bacterium]|jgi:hypothetical protein|nr:hypothetical protein [Spirochaetales bacterium]
MGESKFLKKPDSGTVLVTGAIFIWVFIVNVATVSFIFPAIDAVLTAGGKFFPNTYNAWSTPTWPMFFVTILYFIMGNDPKRSLEIFLGGTFGLLSCLFLFWATWQLMGQSAVFRGEPGLLSFPIAFIPVIFVILGVIILGGAWLPVIFNNAAFTYLIAGSISLGKFFYTPNGVELYFREIGNNFLVFLIGGGIFLLGCIYIQKALIAWLTAKAIKAAAAAQGK